MRLTVISDSVNTVRGAVIFDPNVAATLPLVGVLGSLLGIMPMDQLLTDDQLLEAGLFTRLAHFAPAIVVYSFAGNFGPAQ